MARYFNPCVYILANRPQGVLYIGVTSNLSKRIDEHRRSLASSFTTRYNVHTLVYIEQYETIEQAISREKQLKAGSRKKKIGLIESLNPEWKDLSDWI